MSQLTVEHLAKSYKKRQVVKDVSLNVESGKVIGLLGPNGAGKTTTFYMIVGLVKIWALPKSWLLLWPTAQGMTFAMQLTQANWSQHWGGLQKQIGTKELKKPSPHI